MSPKQQKGEEVDIFRQTWVRYLGYANEVGESLRYVVPKLLVPSYALSILYVLGDTADKGIKAKEQFEKSDKTSPSHRNQLIATSTVDTLLWQSLASVIIPGFTINRIVKVGNLIQPSIKSVLPYSKYFPTVLGLCSIPLIIKPIDHLVDTLLDETVRTYYVADFTPEYQEHSED